MQLDHILIFGGLILLVLFILFTSGSSVDPDDNPLWCSESTKARKRQCKLEQLYKTEIELCTLLNIQGTDTHVRWYHKHGKHYINDTLISVENLGNKYYPLTLMLHTKYLPKERKVCKLPTLKVLSVLGVPKLTFEYMVAEGLI